MEHYSYDYRSPATDEEILAAIREAMPTDRSTNYAGLLTDIAQLVESPRDVPISSFKRPVNELRGLAMGLPYSGPLARKKKALNRVVALVIGRMQARTRQGFRWF